MGKWIHPHDRCQLSLLFEGRKRDLANSRRRVLDIDRAVHIPQSMDPLLDVVDTWDDQVEIELKYSIADIDHTLIPRLYRTKCFQAAKYGTIETILVDIDTSNIDALIKKAESVDDWLAIDALAFATMETPYRSVYRARPGGWVGRVYQVGFPQFQNCRSEVRNAVLAGCWQVDIKTSAPRFVTWYAGYQYDGSLPHLEAFFLDRSAVREEIARRLDCPVKRVKNAISSLLFGCWPGGRRWHQTWGGVERGTAALHDPFFADLVAVYNAATARIESGAGAGFDLSHPEFARRDSKGKLGLLFQTHEAQYVQSVRKDPEIKNEMVALVHDAIILRNPVDMARFAIPGLYEFDLPERME